MTTSSSAGLPARYSGFFGWTATVISAAGGGTRISRTSSAIFPATTKVASSYPRPTSGSMVARMRKRWLGSSSSDRKPYRA